MTGAAIAPAVAGVGAWLFLPVVGRISLTELAAVVLAPCAALVLLRMRGGRALAVATVLWIIGLVIGQRVYPADTVTAVKALSSAGVLALTIGLTCAVIRSGPHTEVRQRLVVGFAVGELVGMALTPPSDAAVDPWKFGIGQAVTMLVLVAADRLRPEIRGLAVPVVLVLLAGLHLVLGARSLCLFALLIAVASMLTSGRRAARGRVLVFGLLAVAVAVLLGTLYTDLATAGTLGAAEQEKVAFQTGDFGIAVGGRKDFVFLISGVLHSPVVGWGPDAVVPPDVKSEAVNWLQHHGYPIYGYDLITFVLPDSLYLHSVILGAWATGGLLALPFWLLAVALIARGLARSLRSRATAESYLLLVALWHVFFSPLGDITRGHIAVAVALSLTTLAPQHRGDHHTRRRVPAGRTGRRSTGHPRGTEPDPAEPEQDTERQHDTDQHLLSPRL